MKLYKTIFIIILNILNIFGQTETWNLLTVSRDLYSINNLSENKMLILAGDYSFKSTDAGVSWSLPVNNNVNAGFSGGSFYNYPDQTSFVDSLFGWTVVYDNTVKKTTNGGQNWITINTSLTNHYITCVQFINRLNGFIAGKTNLNKGFVAKTTNGGNSWTICVNTLASIPSTFIMLNAQKGYANMNSDTLAETNDSWNTVVYKKVGNGQGIQKIYFLDSLNGFVLGNIDFISNTTNGGLSWIMKTVNLGNTVNMFFLNSQTGWVTSTRYRIYRTTNGGNNWILQYMNGIYTNDVYNDILFKNEYTGYACGSMSVLLKTTNSGNNWYNAFNVPPLYINSIEFVNFNTGWIGGSTGLWRSTNRGYNWISYDSLKDILVKDIKFINENTGYFTSVNKLYKTTNSGINWFNIYDQNVELNKISFLNQNTICVCCDSGKVIKTTNSGLTWFQLETGISGYLYDIQFVNDQSGFACSAFGYFVKTTNGGSNWSIHYPFDQKTYRSLSFINLQTGYIAGESTISQPPYPPSFTKVLLKTTDAGNNWSLKYSQNGSGYNKFTDIFFIDENTGWILSDNTGVGVIHRTLNGGSDLSTVFGPIGNGFVTNGFNCIKYLGANRIIAAGDNGSIVSSISPIGINLTNSKLPIHISLSQNYPNPFNPQTKIKFEVPKASIVKLMIYDLLGREVTTLVNEELKPGTYEVDWDGSNFSSGVYFYKIITNDFTETKKMVLMK